MRIRALKSLAVSAAALLTLSAGAVHALPINPASSGLDAAVGCGDTACFFDVLFTLDASAPVSGEAVIDVSGIVPLLVFNVTLDSATLSGSDGPVTGVTFSDVTYSGSFLLDFDGTRYNFLDQNATISGTLTPSGAGSPVFFPGVSANTTGSCLDTGTLTCGFLFGAGTGFAVDVNGNERYFRHTVDIAVIPEPGTALLLGLGLAGLATRRGRERLSA